MDDFQPPSGPPPPKVPEGWKAVWNTQYSEWFYVNVYTKQSQWEKPTSPIYPPGENDHTAPSGPPPTYTSGDSKPIANEKTGLGSNNPYASAAPGVGGGASSSHNTTEEDERYARQLQAEEDARARAQPGGPGASNDYYGAAGPTQGQQQYGQQPPQQYAQQDPYTGQYGQQGQPYSEDKGKRKSGTVGKLLSKLTSSSSSRPHGHAPMYGQPQYGQPGYGQPIMGQPMYGPPGRRPGGGLGAGGGMAMGAVGGLGAGMLLAHGMDGGDDGGYGGDDGGGDYGGDGGDFGGDGGGGDFGGGDMGGGDFGGGD